MFSSIHLFLILPLALAKVFPVQDISTISENSKNFKETTYSNACFKGCDGSCALTNTGTVNHFPNIPIYHIFIGTEADDYKVGVKFYDVINQFGLNLQYSSALYGTLSGYSDNNGSPSTTFSYQNSYSIVVPSDSITDDDIVDGLNQLIQTGTLTADPQAIYVILFRGDYKYNSAAGGGRWGMNFCSFNSQFTVGGISLTVLALGDTSYGFMNGCSSLYVTGTTHLNK